MVKGGGDPALFLGKAKAHGLCPHPEYNLALKRLSFHDMNLADCQSEVLFLLQNLTLQGKFFIQNLRHSWVLTVALLPSH